uniref:XK-related protein n=1 Tax=Steinernema glaseri TaxID=37863 RepID=A0A1I7ZGM8_9BILA
MAVAQVWHPWFNRDSFVIVSRSPMYLNNMDPSPPHEPLQQGSSPSVTGKYWGGAIDVVHESGRIAYNAIFWIVADVILYFCLKSAFGDSFSLGWRFTYYMTIFINIMAFACLYDGLKKKDYRYMILPICTHAINLGMAIALFMYAIYTVVGFSNQLEAEERKKLIRFVWATAKDVSIPETDVVTSIYQRTVALVYMASSLLFWVAYIHYEYWNMSILYKCHRYFYRLETSGQQPV